MRGHRRLALIVALVTAAVAGTLGAGAATDPSAHHFYHAHHFISPGPSA
jgi:hypothetical protein